MKRVVLIPLLAALAAALPTAALAKGASEAEITGPGLHQPIVLAGEGQLGGGQLMQIAQASGFFSAAFGQTPDPMLTERPKGDLGPRYTIAYVMFGTGGKDRLTQDLYPYAAPSPVTYIAPDQSFYGTQETHGGWFVATTALKDMLIAAGLPKTPPVADGPSGFPWKIAGTLTAAVVVAALGGIATLMVRRRPQPA